jgi:predicted TIM-barrel enzyme
VALFNECEAAVRTVRSDVIMICHGGPIAEREHAAHMLAHCPGCHGFNRASSMERLPTERALTGNTRRFTALRTPSARDAR